ncbi:energy-coupling factor transporter transmembrane component T family protein [Mangrovicoccus algicola]|uniref:Energy-coupling factor transporter transmembrane protein EcfT n=1 Tax=Mangrovicoccus algicola TaxID=2771008 RepID=A0A8J6YR00_9RHOB|nr:energy-coupling factor transporter transmembrane protein EcfT [Mangrovicoccus algicola]MBE3637983.1 energy-coupling factor transporter transmembrane protein EcfT [Mangrovicoccus algicola]
MLSLTSEIRTPFHAVPAGAKLAALAVLSVATFSISAPALMLLPLTGTALLYLCGGLRFARAGLRALRPLWPFLALLAIWHGLSRDLGNGALLGGRLLSTVALANLVTMTTRLEDMIAMMSRILAPLAWLGVRPGRIAFAIGLVLRLTPVLLDRGRQLSMSWRARARRRRPGWQIVLPLCLSALDDADHIAEAVRARGGIPD